MFDNLRRKISDFFASDELIYSEIDGDVDYQQDFTFLDHVLDFFGYVGNEEDEFEAFFENFKQNQSMWADNYNETGTQYAATESGSEYRYDDPYLEAELRFDEY
jgi:hypothetical protein